MAKRRTIPKHLKPQRGLGQEVTRARRLQRDALRRGAERERDEAAAAARNELQRLSKMTRPNDWKWYNALLGAVVDEQTAVLRSFGYRQSVHHEVTGWIYEDITAYTDFSSIYVGYPGKKLPARDSCREAILNAIINIRGVMQHEMGHIRFTTPFPTLRHHDERLNGGEGLMEGVALGLYQRIWNILEDQRMETLVVRDVPHIGSYFTRMVYTHIIKESDESGEYHTRVMPWLLVAGRNYLPREGRQMSRDLFNKTLPDVDAGEWYNLVNAYKTATTYRDMVRALYNAVLWYTDNVYRDTEKHPEGGTSHRNPPNVMEPTGQDADPSDACEPEEDDTSDSGSGAPSNEDDTSDNEGEVSGSEGDDSADHGSEGDDDANSGGSGESSTDDDSDGDSDDTSDSDEGDQPTDESAGDKSAGDGEDANDISRKMREKMRETIDDIDESLSDRNDISEVLADANSRADKPGLESKGGNGSTMSLIDVDAAMRASVGIQQALTECVTAVQPAWLSHQDHGAIDPLSYRTKQVGAMDYHRCLTGDFRDGLDIHVSVLCDVSGSMGSINHETKRTDIEELSIAMYAMYDACTALGINSTYVLWSSNGNAHRVWDTDNVEPKMWTASGGTNPIPALDDLIYHNEEGASKHLVIIFTDGMWGGGVPSLSRWRRDNQYIVRVVQGMTDMPSNGADIDVFIKSCSELPDQLAMALQKLI